MDSFSDLAFFQLLIRRGTLAATAQEIGITPSSASKRLAVLENRLGVRLLHRTTRRMSLTPEGEVYLSEGIRLLEQMQELENTVAGAKTTPRGLVKVSATLGFGRQYIAPALSEFIRIHPEVEVQLHLTSQPFNMVEEGFDLSIRFGELPDSRLIARKLANNRRLLCASPAYLEHAGQPKSPRDLQQHRCLFLRESHDTYGSWHLYNGARQETVKIHGPLTGNDGACVLSWALEGHGILMRSEWDIAPYLRSGALRPILIHWSAPPADIYLTYASKAHLTAKTHALIDFMLDRFSKYRIPGSTQTNW